MQPFRALQRLWASRDPAAVHFMVQAMTLLSINFCQGVMLTTPFTLSVYMVRRFEQEQLPPGTPVDEQVVGRLTGLLAGAFSMASFVTSMGWGVISNIIGRKAVLLIGLVVSFISMLWYGLATSYASAVAARAFGGFFNGVLGAWKCLIGESGDSLVQGKLFGYMSVAWGLGTTLGPLIGGSLALPCEHMAGVAWCEPGQLFYERPFFLACLVGSLSIVTSSVATALLLRETLPEETRQRTLTTWRTRWHRLRHWLSRKGLSHTADTWGTAHLVPVVPLERTQHPAGCHTCSKCDPGVGTAGLVSSGKQSLSKVGHDSVSKVHSWSEPSQTHPDLEHSAPPDSEAMPLLKSGYDSSDVTGGRRGLLCNRRSVELAACGDHGVEVGLQSGGISPQSSTDTQPPEEVSISPRPTRDNGLLQAQASHAASHTPPPAPLQNAQHPSTFRNTHTGSSSEAGSLQGHQQCSEHGNGPGRLDQPKDSTGHSSQPAEPVVDQQSSSAQSTGGTDAADTSERSRSPHSAAHHGVCMDSGEREITNSVHGAASIRRHLAMGEHPKTELDLAPTGTSVTAAGRERGFVRWQLDCDTPSAQDSVSGQLPVTSIELQSPQGSFHAQSQVSAQPLRSLSSMRVDSVRSRMQHLMRMGSRVFFAGSMAPFTHAAAEDSEHQGLLDSPRRGDSSLQHDAVQPKTQGTVGDRQGAEGHSGPDGQACVVVVEPDPGDVAAWYQNKQVLLTIAAYGFIAFLWCAIDELVPIFGAAPVETGGLGLIPSELSLPLTVFGITLMVYSAFGYPSNQRMMGTLRLARLGLLTAVGVCFLLPLTHTALTGSSKTLARVVLIGTMVIKSLAQCASFTGALVMVNAAPHKSQLGEVNGVGQTVAALVRGLGPALGGLLWAGCLTLQAPGQQFLPFACVALLALSGFFVSGGIHLPNLK